MKNEKPSKLEKENQQLKDTIKQAIPWLAKMVADGGHKNAAAPNNAKDTLDKMIESVS